MEEHPITGWRTKKVAELQAARAAGDTAAYERITGELRAIHVALGHRQAGTEAEQNAYLVARVTNTPLPELAVVGIDTNDWPKPPRQSSAAAPDSASPATESRISTMFERAGLLVSHQPHKPRYSAQWRPGDGQMYHGQPLPWAICDTVTGLPVAYVPDKELAEYQAEQASELFSSHAKDS
ncbi:MULTISPECIES: hypothetical protein [unclassified Streptomyces]|uniref:hypothetical protein n=1 Tax=unclassified Streptomyces TaxID=2593676 RepID=UPI003333E4EE